MQARPVKCLPTNPSPGHALCKVVDATAQHSARSLHSIKPTSSNKPLMLDGPQAHLARASSERASVEVVLAELPQSVASDPAQEALGTWDPGRGPFATASRLTCGAAVAVWLHAHAAWL